MQRLAELKALRVELDALLDLPAAERAVRARRLGAEAQTLLAAVADEATWELTRQVTYNEAARQLGVAHSRVNHAVTAHLRRA